MCSKENPINKQIQMRAFQKERRCKYPKNMPPKQVHSKKNNVENASCVPKGAWGNFFCVHPKQIKLSAMKAMNIIALYLDHVDDRK